MDAPLLLAYLEDALDHLLEVAERSGGRLNATPFEGTNSIGALVVHCCEVCEFWIGHIALGRESHRDRDAEFVHVAAMPELVERVARTRRQVRDDLEALAAGEGRPSELRQFAIGGGSDESVVLYALKELQQHLGHAELTLDALRD